MIIKKAESLNLHYLFACLTLLKLAVILFSDNNLDFKRPFTIAEPFYSSFLVNPDELDIASVALNYNNGLGYVVKSNYYSRNKLRPTAWRTSFPIFIHIATQRIYLSFFPEDTITIDYQHRYFQYYGFLMQIIALLVFWVSLYFFYKLSFQFLKNKRLATVAVILYTFLPSIIYYVGSMVCYENIALGCVIIVTSIYHQAAQSLDTISWKKIMVVTLFSVWASLLRPHTILIFLFLMGSCFLITLLKRYKFKKYVLFTPGLKLITINLLIMVLMQLPALYKNYQTFGKYTLSTQADYNFLLGHNEFARGSWLGNSGFNSEWDKYIANQIPGIENMNEYEEAKARKQLAVQWIKNNPEKELLLAARKTAMFFLPDNYLHHKEFLNIASMINTLLFLSFIISCIILVKIFLLHPWKEEWLTDGIVYLPVIGSLFFSILFFIDHRWRYYAEPFILLIAFRVILSLLSHLKGNFVSENRTLNNIEN